MLLNGEFIVSFISVFSVKVCVCVGGGVGGAPLD